MLPRRRAEELPAYMGKARAARRGEVELRQSTKEPGWARNRVYPSSPWALPRGSREQGDAHHGQHRQVQRTPCTRAGHGIPRLSSSPCGLGPLAHEAGRVAAGGAAEGQRDLALTSNGENRKKKRGGVCLQQRVVQGRGGTFWACPSHSDSGEGKARSDSPPY